MQVVLPVTAIDILAHAQRVIHFGFVAGPAYQQAKTSAAAGSNC